MQQASTWWLDLVERIELAEDPWIQQFWEHLCHETSDWSPSPKVVGIDLDEQLMVFGQYKLLSIDLFFVDKKLRITLSRARITILKLLFLQFTYIEIDYIAIIMLLS